MHIAKHNWFGLCTMLHTAFLVTHSAMHNCFWLHTALCTIFGLGTLLHTTFFIVAHNILSSLCTTCLVRHIAMHNLFCNVHCYIQFCCLRTSLNTTFFGYAQRRHNFSWLCILCKLKVVREKVRSRKTFVFMKFIN